MSEITVVVVDDHPVVRDGLRALFDTVPDVTLVGEAADAEGAVREVTMAHPDLVLLDIHLPGTSGLEVLARLRTLAPATRVVMLTMHDDAPSLVEAVRAGAHGYLLKGASQQAILAALRAVQDGQTVFGAEVSRHLRGLPGTGHDEVFPELAPREREILDLVAAGLGNASIGARLALSPKTVANHLTTIFHKIAVSDRGHAIVKARDAGLGRG